MLNSNPLTLAAPTQHLRQLGIIRSLLLLFLWSGLGYSHFSTTINPWPLGLVLALMSAITVATFLRLKNPLPVTQTEFFIQLLTDVSCMIVLFFLSGGANNPFISYLLVPVCIAAATLPAGFTWIITLFSLIAYTGLLFFYIEFPLFALEHTHSHNPFNVHILGMWFNFFVSATLITYFVAKMAVNLRQQQEAISRLREDELRNEQLMAVAMLAAGAAHEINTPLSTMTVLLQEMRADHYPALNDDLELLSQQVNQCATILKRLVKESSSASLGEFSEMTITEFSRNLLDRWQLMRPNVQFLQHYAGNNLQRKALFDPRLEMVIINLLNNAADASAQGIRIDVHANTEFLTWTIDDQGEGIDAHTGQQLGKFSYTTKARGLGLGMAITQATLKTFGGEITQIPLNPKGTRTHLKIPMQYSDE